MSDSKATFTLPRWVVVTWHMAAILTAVFLVLLAGINYKTWAEMRAMNAFWNRIEQRQDSINTARRRTADSLRSLGDTLTRTPQ